MDKIKELRQKIVDLQELYHLVQPERKPLVQKQIFSLQDELEVKMLEKKVI